MTQAVFKRTGTMPAIADSPQANQTAAAGSLILESGSPVRGLVILNKGIAEYRMVPPSGRAKSLFRAEAPSVLGAPALLSGEASQVRVVAASDCVVSVYPSNRAGLEKVFAGKPNIALLVMKALLKEAVETNARATSAYGVLSLLTQHFTSFSLGYAAIDPDQFPGLGKMVSAGGQDFGFTDPVLPQARNLVTAFLERGLSIPAPLTPQFLLARQENLLVPDLEEGPQFDRDEFNYLRRLFSLPPEIIGAIAQRDASFLLLSGDRLVAVIRNLQKDLRNRIAQTEDLVNHFAGGEYSWIEKFALQAEMSSKGMTKANPADIATVMKFVSESAAMQKERFEKTWGELYPKLNPQSMDAIKRESVKASAPAAPPSSSGSGVDDLLDLIGGSPSPASASGIVVGDSHEISSEALASARGSLQKICSWVGTELSKVTELREALTALKSHSNILEADNEPRRLRRKITPIYWDIYLQAALKHLGARNIPLPKHVELFLNYGFMDEELLDPEHISFLFTHNPKSQSGIPVYYPIDWLARIYDRESPSSVNELGLTYFEVLREENKDAKWKRESDLPPELNTPAARVKFEIDSLFVSATKSTSGMPLNNFNILNRGQITQRIENSIATKESVGAAVKDLLRKDFSAFHREVLYSNEEMGINREFIQVQVIPNFILVPSSGTQYQFWQDRDSKERSAPGRIIGPMLNMADINHMITMAVGQYRWESVKAALGPDWNNIAQSSITADYVDYVQFFKKNRDLSPEAKEKLAAEFKRHRDDRSRFVSDYALWIKFESEGTQRMNKVARKIFAKHIPFAKDIRESLMKLPAYEEAITKCINVRRRKAADLEPRYRKYRSENDGIIPQELEDTYKFYHMED